VFYFFFPDGLLRYFYARFDGKALGTAEADVFLISRGKK
jgi:hypothetical protein